ncbi:ferredoxin reductase [Gephyromycinifex aptenodytis]|uniref:ferredoxin reductase n=1 Tax=Gephyromycinifex aptenodytis TaxID=2716227 RepID=UPI001D0132F6|nr:ferredoxin reductase [Gephyromycinifex aptenodytis]
MLTTPLLPTDYLDLIDPLRLGADLRGRLVRRQPETADSATLFIRPGRAWRPHTPGQYIRIGVEINGVRHWRAYSLTSPPNTPDGLIAITVKKIPDGVVSAYLVDEVPEGTLLMLDQATGEFVQPQPLPPQVLFITAGSGITPVMGMLRSHQFDDVTILHSAPTAADVVFGPELRALADASRAQGARLRLIERHTDSQGILDLGQLDEVVPDWRERETWACGPAAMLDAAEETWDAAGAGQRLHTERFRPAVTSVGEGGAVTFTRSEVVIDDADGGRPLLDTGEEAGVIMPSGCRMGICFGCAAPLREGSVRDLRTGETTTAAPGDGVIIQTCVSAPAGACQIDL